MQPLRYIILLFCFFYFCPFNTRAQKTPYLEKKINLKAGNIPLSDVFKLIETQTGVVFSYNPKQVNAQRKINAKYVNTPLRLVMDDLVKLMLCGYKLKNNYIILLCESRPETQPLTASVFSGYIYSSTDSSVLENVSVYLSSGKYAAVSDRYGYFSISFSKTQTKVQLSVAKRNFKDTSFTLSYPAMQNVKLYIDPLVTATIVPVEPIVLHTPNKTPDSLPAVTATPPVPEKRLSWLPNINKMKVNLKNIKDTFFNRFSLSLVPPIGTNKLLSFNTVNKYSLNLLVGYSKGVSIVEIGGAVNVDDGNVSYAQVGGIGNHVSGSVKGAQVGGVYNMVKQEVNGAQVGGVFSFSKKITGAQVGGVFTHAQQIKGVQVSGVYSYASQKVSGGQIGGVFTMSDTVAGLQLGGVFNHSGYLKGVQVAGLFNHSTTMNGFQLAPFNFARDAKGIPFGFFSFVKNGYHKIEVSLNEMRMANLGFRTGVDHLHNVFFAGISVQETNRLWTYGYGFGTSFKITDKWSINADISAQQLNPVGSAQKYLDLVNRILVTAEFAPAKKLRVALGPSYNIRVSDMRGPAYTMLDHINYMSNQDGGNSFINTKMWMGVSLSVKFL